MLREVVEEFATSELRRWLATQRLGHVGILLEPVSPRHPSICRSSRAARSMPMEIRSDLARDFSSEMARIPGRVEKFSVMTLQSTTELVGIAILQLV